MRFLRSLLWLAVLTAAGLGLTGLLLLAVPVLTIANRAIALDAFTSDSGTYRDLERFTSTNADIGWLDDLLPFAGGVSLLLFLGWLYRARRELEHLDGAAPRWGWGWTVAGWLVPVANLVVPAAVVADVARESRPAYARTQRRLVTTLVWLGWLAVLGGIGGNAYLAATRAGHLTTVGLVYSYGSLTERLDPEVREKLVRMVIPASPSPADLAVYVALALGALAGVAIVGLATSGLRRREPAR
jgi:hypothetical protein